MTKRILLIEDEEYLADMYKMCLEGEGFEVICEYNGQEGWNTAQKVNPDLILLDILMPHMNGYMVLGKLKENPKTKNIPVYIVSNLSREHEYDKGLLKGADGYWVKANLTPAELAQNVKEVFAKMSR